MITLYLRKTDIRFLLILFLSFKFHSCEDAINTLFEQINEATVKFNRLGAEIAWQYSVDPNDAGLTRRSADYQLERIVWQQRSCEVVEGLHEQGALNVTQQRQAHLLCRGPKFTYEEARAMSNLYDGLLTIYSNAAVCVPNISNVADGLSHEAVIKQYLVKLNRFAKVDGRNVSLKTDKNAPKREAIFCIKGEEEFDKLMKTSKDPEVLEFVWKIWREDTRYMRAPFRELVNVQNEAARRNGYTNIGEFWRDELEIDDLRTFCRRLYQSVKPLYELVHGVVRFYLRQRYGDVVSARGPIPAHLLGNLWSYNWEPLAEFIIPKTIDLDDRMKSLNWTVIDMVKRADDFYISLGLPAMTETFWSKSLMTRVNDNERCHGTAADMFKDGDFRLLYCSGTSFEDFSVLHHEMGHIQYYMAYQHRPGLFRQANTALHESVGDAIMYGVRTPQHLHRIRLLNDTELFDVNNNNKINKNVRKTTVKMVNAHRIYKNNIESDTNRIAAFIDDSDVGDISTDDILILKQALNKLPQIPFSLLIDEYRWRYFEGSLDENSLNRHFWDMVRELQGVVPPERRGEEYFDVGAVFHVADNTPYIRYFLSSFLQHQLFESLCRASVRGRRPRWMPAKWDLLRCDIYGSKVAGKILKDLMSRGSSQPWRQILEETIGESNISATSLNTYYRPLYKLLTRLVQKYSIPIGW
ncbi:putative angiotensin-converting enzyme [Danaus plexippus plexippus]|uniref:Angiotensin-converting enzyme n=1 Tax=Danaus plexippus plexippus TaxID=278856 RepID=A0A212FC18_DANPL|nr:putative angiotensin-converting enzyme [Danaus plexippus plexippus]